MKGLMKGDLPGFKDNFILTKCNTTLQTRSGRSSHAVTA